MSFRNIITQLIYIFYFSEIEFASFLECMHDHSSVENPEKELLDAFRAHDRQKQGYVNASDVRNILMNLGEKLSNREGTNIITYTIYVHCRKIYNLFVRALETGRKASIWQTFVACFTASANKFDI